MEIQKETQPYSSIRAFINKYLTKKGKQCLNCGSWDMVYIAGGATRPKINKTPDKFIIVNNFEFHNCLTCGENTKVLISLEP